MLAQHLSLYARSTGLDRCIRFGCKLHRAKWQAMNGCWRLEYRNGAQRGQLSADLLVVSKSAVAVPRMPKLQVVAPRNTHLHCKLLRACQLGAVVWAGSVNERAHAVFLHRGTSLRTFSLRPVGTMPQH